MLLMVITTHLVSSGVDCEVCQLLLGYALLVDNHKPAGPCITRQSTLPHNHTPPPATHTDPRTWPVLVGLVNGFWKVACWWDLQAGAQAQHEVCFEAVGLGSVEVFIRKGVVPVEDVVRQHTLSISSRCVGGVCRDVCRGIHGSSVVGHVSITRVCRWVAAHAAPASGLEADGVHFKIAHIASATA